MQGDPARPSNIVIAGERDAVFPSKEHGLTIGALNFICHEIKCASGIGLGHHQKCRILDLSDNLLCMISSFIDPFSDETVYYTESGYTYTEDIRRPFLSLPLICRRWFHVTRSASSLCPVLRLASLERRYWQFAFNRLVHRNLQVLDLSNLILPPIDPTCARNNVHLRYVSAPPPSTRLFKDSFDHWERRMQTFGGASTVPDMMLSLGNSYLVSEMRVLREMQMWYNIMLDLQHRWSNGALVSLRAVSMSFRNCDQRGGDRLAKELLNSIVSGAPNLEHLVFFDGSTGTCDPGDSTFPSILSRSNGALAKKLRTFCVVVDPSTCEEPSIESVTIVRGGRMQPLPNEGIKLPCMRDFSIASTCIWDGEIRTLSSMADSIETLRIIGCYGADGSNTWMELFKVLTEKAKKLKKLVLVKNLYTRGEWQRHPSTGLDDSDKKQVFRNPLRHLPNGHALEELHLYSSRQGPLMSSTIFSWPQLLMMLIAMPRLKVLLLDYTIRSTGTELPLAQKGTEELFVARIFQWIWPDKQGWKDIMAARKNRPFDVLVLRAPSTDEEESYPIETKQGWKPFWPNRAGHLELYWHKLIALAQYYLTNTHCSVIGLGEALKEPCEQLEGVITRNFGWFMPRKAPDQFLWYSFGTVKGSYSSWKEEMLTRNRNLKFFPSVMYPSSAQAAHGIFFAVFGCQCGSPKSTRFCRCDDCFVETFIKRNGPDATDAINCAAPYLNLDCFRVRFTA